jgi:NAD(P)-dependent dehydrogenase (short-subunit alcohol dehydrogenase family)
LAPPTSRARRTSRATAAAALGPIGGCFNTGAIEGPVTPLADYDDAAFDAVIAVDLRGVYLGLKHVLPAMRDGGAVVNSSGALGQVGAPGLCACVASKHAVIGLTKVAALEGAARGIRVNAVCPGPIVGRMIQALEAQAFAGADTTFAAFVSLGRHGTPDEVARFVMFLLSDDAVYATGSAHSMDGAMVAA